MRVESQTNYEERDCNKIVNAFGNDCKVGVANMKEIILIVNMWIVTICTYISYVPQIVKIIKTKNPKIYLSQVGVYGVLVL